MCFCPQPCKCLGTVPQNAWLSITLSVYKLWAILKCPSPPPPPPLSTGIIISQYLGQKPQPLRPLLAFASVPHSNLRSLVFNSSPAIRQPAPPG